GPRHDPVLARPRNLARPGDARRRPAVAGPQRAVWLPAVLADCFDVPATVIVGAQWGDEGKGKIVDLLAQSSDVVCRYQGGPNAGHTVVVRDETYKIRQIPTGLITGTHCAIGAGCVVDPEVLVGELDEL